MNSLQNLFDISGKTVVVTGATGQLGQTFVRALNALGARVFGIDQKVESPEQPGEGYFSADVVNQRDFDSVLSRICEKTGGAIDILVNNAGVSVFEPFEQRTDERFDWVMAVNLKGVFHGIQSYVRLHDQWKNRSGCIINVASHYGVISPDFRIYGDGDRRNSEVYGATKAGVIQMTRYFAVHLAERGIRVNAVSPGGIFNPKNPQSDGFRKNYEQRVPMRRMGNEEELVGAIVFLASPSASYLTGQNIIVDGGMTCW
jgi:NAD(P)-dependent dehydrogenase (short-subunit alcohol dehydrogenase family)